MDQSAITKFFKMKSLIRSARNSATSESRSAICRNASGIIAEAVKEGNKSSEDSVFTNVGYHVVNIYDKTKESDPAALALLALQEILEVTRGRIKDVQNRIEKGMKDE